MLDYKFFLETPVLTVVDRSHQKVLFRISFPEYSNFLASYVDYVTVMMIMKCRNSWVVTHHHDWLERMTPHWLTSAMTSYRVHQVQSPRGPPYKAYYEATVGCALDHT